MSKRGSLLGLNVSEQSEKYMKKTFHLGHPSKIQTRYKPSTESPPVVPGLTCQKQEAELVDITPTLPSAPTRPAHGSNSIRIVLQHLCFAFSVHCLLYASHELDACRDMYMLYVRQGTSNAQESCRACRNQS